MLSCVLHTKNFIDHNPKDIARMTTLNFPGLPQDPQAAPIEEDEAQLSFQPGDFVDLDDGKSAWPAEAFPGGEALGQLDRKVDADFKNNFPDVCDESDVKKPARR